MCSIDKVKTELDVKEDDLKEWANQEFEPWFQITYDVNVRREYGEIMKWVETSNFNDKAKMDFTDVDRADAWIIAYAKANGHTVVTHEKFKPNIRRKVLILNVCNQFQIKSINTFQMLRDLGIQF